jgi:transcriptional regulator with XRE-family HTH domain
MTSKLLRFLFEKAVEGSKPLLAEEISREIGLSGSNSANVRASVMRLRKSLDEFYRFSVEGRNAPWSISIPMAGREGYRVAFAEQRPAASPMGQSSTLSTLRKTKGLTQQQLSEIANVSTKTIQAIERGRPATAEILYAIAKALAVDVQELMTAPAGTVDIQEKLEAEADFEVQFDPEFDPSDVKYILTALADYYRASGGAGFEIDLEMQEAIAKEPVHA